MGEINETALARVHELSKIVYECDIKHEVLQKRRRATLAPVAAQLEEIRSEEVKNLGRRHEAADELMKELPFLKVFTGIEDK